MKMLKVMKDINMSKDVKYIEIRSLKLDNKRMKDITFVDNVDICWNKYKYQKELKYNERVEIR
jgi:hypothetical protein